MSNRAPSTSSATNSTLRRFLTALFCRMPGGSRCLILIAAVTLAATGLARTTVEGRHGEAVGQEPPTAPDATIDRVRNPPIATDLDNLPGDLRTIVVPEPANLGDFVKDRQAAIALGKALFWDMQVGSDGIQACASCHFRAGADPRSKNQVSPGLKHVPAPDTNYKTGDAPNVQLQASHFPLTRLASPGTRGALDPGTDSDDVVSSQGIHHPGDEPDPLGFRVGTANTRRVEPRNTPTVINAVFNHRQFWDGRAENVFNGVNHLGDRDPSARVFRADQPNNPIEVQVRLVNASLASQAVAPIVSDLEMAEPGRTPQDVGRDLSSRSRLILRRLQAVRPLAKQRVHPADSVLGPLSRWPWPGLAVSSYEQMIKAAFHEPWWRSFRLIQVSADGKTKRIVLLPDLNPATEEFTLIDTTSRSSSASPCRCTKPRSSPTTRRGIASGARTRHRAIRT